MAKTAKQKNPLGRLSSFGLNAPWQVALLLPSGWDDLTKPLERFDTPVFEGDRYVVRGRLAGTSQAKFQGTPRLTGSLVDNRGERQGFSCFGDTRELQEQLESVGDNPVVLFGSIAYFNDRSWLNNVEMVSPIWLCRLRPRYHVKVRSVHNNGHQ